MKLHELKQAIDAYVSSGEIGEHAQVRILPPGQANLEFVELECAMSANGDLYLKIKMPQMPEPLPSPGE